MKHLTFITGLILSVSMGQSIATAPVSTTGNNFSLITPFNTATGGTNDVTFTWDESYQSAVIDNGSNATISSPTSFFGGLWTAHDVVVYGPGTYTVDTNCPAGAPTCIGSTVNYTAPTVYLNAVDTFTYTIVDENGGIGTATVNVTINPVNDAPILSNDLIFTDQDVAITFDPRGNDSDEEGDTFVINAVETNTTAANGTVNFTGNDITYTPDAGFFGKDIFTYDVDDGNGGITVGTSSFPGKGVVTVVVKKTGASNPGTATDAAPTTNEDAPVTVIISPLPADATEVMFADPGVNGTCGFSQVSITSRATFTPDKDWFGSETCTVYIMNNDGGTNTVTVDFTIAARNDKPVVVPDSIATTQDTPATISPVFSDVDVGDVLVISGISTNPKFAPQNGMVTFTDSTLTYTPDPGFFGIDKFTYYVSDGTTIGLGKIVVAVNQPGNTAPTPMDDSLIVDENNTLIFGLPVVTTSYFIDDNDSDPDGDDIRQILNVTQGTEGVTGYTVSRDYVFTVATGEVGAHMLFDWNGALNIDVVNIWNMDVIFGTGVELVYCGGNPGSDCGTGTSDPWSADPLYLWNGSSIDIDMDGKLGLGMVDGPFKKYNANFNVMGVYANTPAVLVDDPSQSIVHNAVLSGTLTATDANPDPLTYSIDTNGTLGTAAITDASTGAFTYTPNILTVGVDSFTYVVNDRFADSNIATVTVTITNTAPGAATPKTPEDAATGVNAAAPNYVWTNAIDADGDTLTYDLVLCTDAAMMMGCTTDTNVATLTVSTPFMLAGLGSGVLLLGLTGLAMGSRRQRFMQLAILAVLAITMHACSSSGGGSTGPAPGDSSYTGAPLAAATTYYWMIQSTDGIDTTDSAISSFTTQ